jgi:hypothetical protein
VRLTEWERKLVARRAYGEYGVNESIDRIWREHRKKNRTPEDAPYLEFMRVVYKKTFDWDDYVEAALPLHALHPYPWGPVGEPEVHPNPNPGGACAEPPKKRKRRKRRTPEQVIQEAEIAPPVPPAPVKKKRRRRRKASPKEEIVPPEPPEEPEGPPEETTEDGMVMGDDGFMWLPPGWEPLEE